MSVKSFIFFLIILTSNFVGANETININSLDQFIEQQMIKLNIPGLSIAVISNGEIIYHQNKGVANIDSEVMLNENAIFEAASLSKPVFAYLVMRLVKNGIIDLDRPLRDYLQMPEMEHDSRYYKTTARMVLSHSTGFPNWRWFDPAPAEMNIPRGQMYLKSLPGTFSYSGEAYNYLAEVIAHLTHHDMTSINDLFLQEVATPLGMKNSSYIQTPFIKQHKVSGHVDNQVQKKEWPKSFPDDTPLTFGAAGRLHTNAHEYAKFMVALMNGVGLNPTLLRTMLRAHTELPADSKTTQLTGQTAWGLGIAIEPTPSVIRYEHGGNNSGFQSAMMFYLGTKTGYVFMTNSDRGKAFNQAIESYLTAPYGSKEPKK